MDIGQGANGPLNSARPAWQHTEFAAGLAALEDKPLFHRNAMPSLERYHSCMHASYFIYEFKVRDEYKVIKENFCAHTSQGVQIMKAFYAIANITPVKDKDWGLIDNFDAE